MFDHALERVVRDLNRADATAAHDVHELREGSVLVVRDADGTHPLLVTQALERRQPRAPRHQVVHLIEVDIVSVVPKRPLKLPLRLRIVGGPDLGRHQRLLAAPIQRLPQHALGGPVHRRRIEQVRSQLQRPIHHPPTLRHITL